MESLEVALIKYNKKTWSKSALLGLFIGLAVIVPGISGSTVAIIFKLYDQFLYAMGNLFKSFKKCFLFLLPIGIGAILGALLGFFAVKRLLNFLPFATVCLFAGLMSGAFPAVKDEVKGVERTPLRVVLFAIGLFIPLVIGIISAFLGEGDSSSDAFARVEWWHFIIALAMGALMSVTQIVPGLSASAFLMAIGWFSSLVDSVSFTYWQENPAVFLVYAGLGLGFVGGLLGFSNLLTRLFARARYTAYCAIVGLSLGSIFAMFCNGDILAVYASWVGGVPILEIIVGVALFAVGVISAYALVRVERKKQK